MAVTPNYSLSIYPSSDTTTKFLDFRVAVAGTQTTSNFYVIDTVLKTHADQITSLQNSPSTYTINASYSAANYYTATSASYPGYLINQLISLSLNQNNVGTVTISINGGSTVSVMKYNYSGTLVNMESNDFIANNQILCIYDGIEFVAIGVKNANIVNIAGTIGDVVTISSNNTLTDSGVKIGAANGLATLDSSSNVMQNANTASKLKTAINIGSASFDGSNSITATQMGVIPNVTTPTEGNFPLLTSTGTLQNSSYNPSSFPQGTITLDSTTPTETYYPAVYKDSTGKALAFTTLASRVFDGTSPVSDEIQALISGTTPAGTATALATSRTIGLASFNGTADITLSDIGAEPIITKNTAFNKNFGTASDTVCHGNDSRLSDSRRASNISMSYNGNLYITYS